MDVDILAHAGPEGRADVQYGVERRRRWTAEQKGQIVAASFAAGTTTTEVARRYGISPQHLFLWRKAARTGRLVLPVDDEMTFAQVVLESGAAVGVAGSELGRRPGGGVEVEISGALIRVTNATDLKLLVGVIGALKAAG